MRLYGGLLPGVIFDRKEAWIEHEAVAQTGPGQANFMMSGHITLILQSPNHQAISMYAPYKITFETESITGP